MYVCTSGLINAAMGVPLRNSGRPLGFFCSILVYCVTLMTASHMKYKFSREGTDVTSKVNCKIVPF